jgi:hypothetical protein
MSNEVETGCGRLLGYGIAGAVIIGLPSFLAGYIGPVIFTPQSNQGPLLGIFITGPAGAIIGFIAGVLYANLRSRKH